MIPGLTVVKKPMETYLIVREDDGDRELTAAECDLIAALLNPDRQKCELAGLNALKARYPNDLIFSNAGFAIGVVSCVVDSTLRAQGLSARDRQISENNPAFLFDQKTGSVTPAKPDASQED